MPVYSFDPVFRLGAHEVLVQIMTDAIGEMIETLVHESVQVDSFAHELINDLDVALEKLSKGHAPYGIVTPKTFRASMCPQLNILFMKVGDLGHLLLRPFVAAGELADETACIVLFHALYHDEVMHRLHERWRASGATE